MVKNKTFKILVWDDIEIKWLSYIIRAIASLKQDWGRKLNFKDERAMQKLKMDLEIASAHFADYLNSRGQLMLEFDFYVSDIAEQIDMSEYSLLISDVKYESDNYRTVYNKEIGGNQSEYYGIETLGARLSWFSGNWNLAVFSK